MDPPKNFPSDSAIDEVTSRSELGLVPLLIPKTVQKKRLTFEGDEIEASCQESPRPGNLNESFNPYATYPLEDPNAPIEDEYDKDPAVVAPPPKPPQSCWSIFVHKCKDILHSPYYTILINSVTIYVLIADYFRIMLFNKDADKIFDVFTIICLCFLILDFLLMFISQKKYVFSFYFFLDIVMTVTVFFDVTTISEAMFSKGSDNVKLITSNILRIIRIIRLIRIMKFLRSKNKKPESPDGKTPAAKEPAPSPAALNKNEGSLVKKIFTPKESKVTTQLKDMNVKRIIVIVLLILIVVPLFDNSLYYQDRSSTSFDKAVFMAYNFVQNSTTDSAQFIKDLGDSIDDSSLFLVKYVIQGVFNYTHPSITGLRDDEIDDFSGTITCMSQVYGVSVSISHRSVNVMQALLNLLNTFFVGIIMIGSILSLNNDMSTLVLNPLERMIGKIRLIGINPLLALKSSRSKTDDEADTNETYVIEAAINKITSLLMLGFGQAGCKIVSGFVLDSNRDIDQLIPGEKTYAIFGFCDIKGFADVTEVLIEDIMLFVNTIASIVHQNVDEFAGATNKNIGEAFLMVWKLMDDGYKYFIDEGYRKAIMEKPEKEQSELLSRIVMEDRFNRQLAEFAVLGFTKVLMEVNTNVEILKFAELPLIKTKMPGFEVKMSFGLHIGWAIEGAIGSSYKIDASYLSPNVNLASRVQYACKQFNLSLLYSGNLFELFTNPSLTLNARHIDTVNLKGSKLPIKLYTFDFNYERLMQWKKETRMSAKFQGIKIDIKSDLQKQYMEILKKNPTITDLGATLNKSKMVKFSSMVEESLVDKKINEPDFVRFLDFDNQEKADFRSVAKFAVDTYLSGDWRSARSLFERCLRIKPNDGPSLTIYEYMKGREFQLPSNWKNCREMTEK